MEQVAIVTNTSWFHTTYQQAKSIDMKHIVNICTHSQRLRFPYDVSDTSSSARVCGCCYEAFLKQSRQARTCSFMVKGTCIRSWEERPLASAASPQLLSICLSISKAHTLLPRCLFLFLTDHASDKVWPIPCSSPCQPRYEVRETAVVHTARASAPGVQKRGQKESVLREVKKMKPLPSATDRLRTLQPHMIVIPCMQGQSIGHRASLDAALVCPRPRSPRTVFSGSGNHLISSPQQLALRRQLNREHHSCKRSVRPPRARRRVQLVRGAMAGLSTDQELIGEQPAKLLLVSINLLLPGLITSVAAKSRRQCLSKVKDHRPGECMSKH